MENEVVEKKKKKPLIREIIELVAIFAVMLVIFNFVLMSVRVNGTSMVPNYVDGERGIMMRSLPFNQPSHGAVVVIEYYDDFEDEKELIVKRVFGMPNDTIEIKDNKVLVNGKEVVDTFRAADTMMDDHALITLGDDEIFVLGDNRNVSKDSRMIGPVKLSQIKAVHGIVFWPLDKIGFMD